MATAAHQVAATFLSFLSSSTHHLAPSSVSLGTTSVLPVSLRAAGTRGPRLAYRLRGRRVGAAVAQLPTTHPEVVSGEKKIRWSSRAVRSFAMAELEARKMRYPTTGTEGLLMGILVEGEDGEVNANHLLLGIWSDDESAGHKILYSLGFDDVKASLLAKTADEEAAMSPR
uniref:Clp R domain-containing protein n=1 Tax=Zea mays TaxID=4577 RepID=A0A804LH27_MAIZE